MPDTFNNLILFVPDDDEAARLHLKVEGQWTMRPGVKPSVFAATVAASDFAALKGKLRRTGSVQFYFASDPALPEAGGPDLIWKRIALVDVEPLRFGVVPPATEVGWYEYRLHFADRREAFAWPGGGALDFGEINKEPLSQSGTKDANGRATRTLRQLVDLCLEAMGIKGELTAPHALSDMPRPMNLDWRGTKAPDELERLLADAGFCFLVKPDGTLAIEEIGAGVIPVPPKDRTIMDAPYPGIDRRGEIIVLGSEPNPVVNTRTYTGTAGDLEFMVLDADDQWKTIREASYFTAPGAMSAEQTVRNRYQNIPLDFRQRVMNTLYRTIRVNPAVNGGGIPVLRYRYSREVALQQIWFEAMTVRPTVDGMWEWTGQYVPVAADMLMDSGRLIHLADRVGGLKDDKAKAWDADADFRELKNYELRIQASWEVYDKQKDGTWRPRFFRVGFKQEPGTTGGFNVRRLTEGELATYLATPGAKIIPRPELQLYQLEDADVNRADIEKLAYAMATRWLAGSGQAARQIMVAGFYPMALSGQVQEVTIVQDPPQSSCTINTWFFANRFGATVVERSKAGADVKFPGQVATSEQRVAAGVAGSSQPVVPVAPPQAGSGELAYRTFVVKLTAVEGDAGGRYAGPTFLYDVFSGSPTGLQNPAIAKKLAPEAGRVWGKFQAATIGLAYYDADRVLHLYSANELPEVSDCAGETT